MKKSDRIEAALPAYARAAPGLHPCYAGWFHHFNAGEYYEAHDVLEHLWLQTPGEDHLFYKGLIQLAGAFVHLRKQAERPWHTKDGHRLQPAARLFHLALANLARYAPRHHGLEMATVHALASEYLAALELSHFTQNPWSPTTLPQLTLPTC